MKATLCKCRGDKPDGSGYTECGHKFILTADECCPKCGSPGWYRINEIEIPDIAQIYRLAEEALTILRTKTNPGELPAVDLCLLGIVAVCEGENSKEFV